MPELSHLSHVIGSFVTGTAITSARQEARPNSVVPPLLRQAVECGGTETMEILNGDKVPFGDNKGATDGNVFKDTIRFTRMYPPFLTSMLTSKGLCS